jgi:hypothetical protein
LVLVDPPSDNNIVQNKWVLKIETGADESRNHHKDQHVAEGYSQEYVIDYKETLSPVKRNSTIKKLFGLAAE